MGNLFLPYLREYLFPSGCGACGEAFESREDAFYGLCGSCRRFFIAALSDETRCEVCGKPLISEIGVCLSCRTNAENRGPAGIAKQLSLFPYSGKLRKALGAYKFEKSVTIANFFMFCLKEALGAFEPGALSSAAWVPVPPKPGKIKASGWDQIEQLAKLLERDSRRKRAGERPVLPVRRCLKRLPSRSQKELSGEERKSNLKGRILCAKAPPETAVIFDDVITTGATMEACAEALLEGGAERVYAVSLFYD